MRAKPDWFLDSEKSVMKSRFVLFRRANDCFCEDSTTRKQTSLKTKDAAAAANLRSARNETGRHSEMNLQLAQP
jgi:hypothetical protein